MTHCPISETKIDERFIRMLHKASTTQSTQVTGPLIVMETTRAAQSSIKTPSPKGISLVFDQEENKRRKDLEDTMNIIKNSMFQKKFDALSLNTNASVEHIDAIPLIRSTRTVNDIPLKISETSRNATEKETHDTKSNSNITGKVLVKRSEYAPGVTKESSISNEIDCYKTDLVNIERNEYGHVTTRPTTSVNRSDSKIHGLFYMGDDSRIADSGANATFAGNGNPVQNIPVRVHQEREHNEVETTLSRTRHSFNGTQSTSQKREFENKISRKSFPNIFKNAEDSGLTKIVHNIVSKISSNVDARDNTTDIKAKKITLDREPATNAQVNSIENKGMHPEQRNISRRPSSTSRSERCLTEVISMKQNEPGLSVTKASTNILGDHLKNGSKIENIRKCESVKKYNIVTEIEPVTANDTSASRNDRSLSIVSMKLKDLKDKPKIELLNTRETAQIGKKIHNLQSGSCIDEGTKTKTIEENQSEHIVIEEISDIQNDINITVSENNNKSNPKKSFIEERSKAQTNLLISETVENNDTEHNPVRETTSPGVGSVSKIQADTAKLSGLTGSTTQNLPSMDRKTDNNSILNVSLKIASDYSNLIKSCLESTFETVLSTKPAIQNTFSQTDHCDCETEEVVNKQSSNIQSERKVTETKVFISNDSKGSLLYDSSQNRNCVDDTINPSRTPNINESNTIKNEHNTTENNIKEGETSNKGNTNINSNTDENVANNESIKSESVHTDSIPIISSDNIYSNSHSDRNVIQFRLDNMNKLLYTPRSKKGDDLSRSSYKTCESEQNGSNYTFQSNSDYKTINDYKHALLIKCPFCPPGEMDSSKIGLPCAVSDYNISEYISSDTDQTGQTTSASFDVSTSIIDDENTNASNINLMAKELAEPSNSSKDESGPSHTTAATGNETTIKDRIRALLFPPFINEDAIILKPIPKKK